MSDYTKINFMDIDAGPNEKSQKRFSRSLLDSKDLGVTLWRYAPNYQSPKAHSHEVQEEVYIVTDGSGRILLNDKTEELKKWDVVRVAPETIRSFEAGAEGLEMVIAGGPKPDGGDGKLADASWPAAS